MAVDTFLASSFGTFVLVMLQGRLTAPSWQTFTFLACGWALASGRHTMTAYLWLTGAVTVKHCSRFSVFLGCPFYDARWQVWACIIRHAAPLIPAEAPLVVAFDDTTQKKAGQHIAGLARYRNGAGSARQAYRTLRGLNVVLGIMHVPLRRWPGHAVTVPLGLERSLKAEPAPQLGLPYRSRRALARTLVDCVATQLPGRPIRALGDGGYATKEFLRHLPPTVHVLSRWRTTGKLDELPAPPTGRGRGRPPQTGSLLGSPKTLQQTPQGWGPHPPEAGAEVQAWVGLWHTVLPGRLVRVVVIRRLPATPATQPGQRQPLPSVDVFFTTDLALSGQDLLEPSRNRWAIDITMRDSHTFDGLGQDQCRPLRRLVGVNTFRLVLAAARTLWCLEHTSRTTPVDLRRFRPWYRQQCAPSQRDIVWACREAVNEAGVFPIPRFIPDLTEHHEVPEHALPSAA
jgi:hypothetical protein